MTDYFGWLWLNLRITSKLSRDKPSHQSKLNEDAARKPGRARRSLRVVVPLASYNDDPAAPLPVLYSEINTWQTTRSKGIYGGGPKHAAPQRPWETEPLVCLPSLCIRV